jgi:hypothetical protein
VSRRALLPLLLLAALAPLARAAGPIQPADPQALLRVASTLSGLPVRRPVPIVVESEARFRQRSLAAHDRAYSRAAQSYDEALYGALGLAGALRPRLLAGLTQAALYDPRTRAVYVPRGRTAPRGVLLEQLVHALQDQAFDLRRLPRRNGARDAALAALAAVDGHASLVARGAAAAATPGRGAPLARFLALERGFPEAVGVRLAATLRNLGGEPAVLGPLRRFPETTEQVFHVDKLLERERPSPIILPASVLGLELASSDTFGELDVRALLASFEVPRLDRAGTGWGGGRSAIYGHGTREATVLALDWDEELDALEWLEAVRGFVDHAFDPVAPGRPAQTPCPASTCWELAGHPIAAERSGVRTALVVGPDLPTAGRIARALVGLTVELHSRPQLEG